MDSVEAAIDSGLGIITLNRGERGNPIGPEMLEDLRDSFELVDENPQVRAILIRSNAPAFCVGMDLDILNKSTGALSEAKGSVVLYSRILRRIHSTGKPVICLIDGDVKAGGVGLVAACDIVLGTEYSNFCLSEVLFDLIPANVLPYLLGLRLSPQKTRFLMLTAKKVDAEEALRIGLIDQVVTRDSMEKSLRGYIRGILRSSPDALKAVKQFTSEVLWSDLDSAREKAIEKLIDIVEHGKVQSAIKAFDEGEVPTWFSRFKPQEPLFSRKEE